MTTVRGGVFRAQRVKRRTLITRFPLMVTATMRTENVDRPAGARIRRLRMRRPRRVRERWPDTR